MSAPKLVRAAASVLLLVLVASGCNRGGGTKTSSGGGAAGGKVIVGYIVKTTTNPFFVAMRQAAEAEASAKGVQLIFEAGKYDGDVATQISEMDDLITRGAKAIVIIPNVSAGVVPAVQRARAKGITVFAVDTATDPKSATNSFLATDNYKAGLLNGEWAKSAMKGQKAVIALLEGTPGSSVNTDRMGGFLKGFGASQSNAVADLVTSGDQAKAQTAMENALAKNPGINLVWTINEPAALGAATAIKAHGLAGKIKIVSMDGGCRGIRAVQDGTIDTDVMQFPKKMATLAIDYSVDAAGGKQVPAQVDTGEILVTKTPQPGVDSKAVDFGLANCWG